MGKLALLGGQPTRKGPYPLHVTTDEQEKVEVLKVLETGVLSAYEGANNQWFMGGEQVKLLEVEFQEKFGVKHAVAVNSATSGLYCAIGAAGLGPGDEAITTPWTMTATAAAVLVYNAIPIFSDIAPDTCNLDPKDLVKRITPRTKAIMPVHIFGHPADMDEIMSIANRHGLTVIEDAAQSMGGLYKGRYTGTIGDMGVFSFNSNKILQCGEGGVVVTDNDELALRLRLIRNHAEAVIAGGMKVPSLVNMLGWNYRMNEIEAAICRIQLTKLEGFLASRTDLAEYLTEKLSGIPGIEPPAAKPGCTHTYYRYAVSIDSAQIPLPADLFLRALNAEGMDFYKGYEPLYLQPLYQEKLLYGTQGCPFTCAHYQGTAEYGKGLCPNAEGLRETTFSTEVVRPPLGFKDMDEIYEAFKKVVENCEMIAAYANLGRP